MRFITLVVFRDIFRQVVAHVATLVNHSRVIALLGIVMGRKIQDTRISIISELLTY